MKSHVAVVAVMAVGFSQGCSLPISTLPPPTETLCAWTENPGPPPPEVEARAEELFAGTGLQGDVWVQGNGEYACGEFYLRDITFEFTIDVPDLADTPTMTVLAARVQDIPAQALEGTRWGFQPVRLRFTNRGVFCWWRDVEGCGDIMQDFRP